MQGRLYLRPNVVMEPLFSQWYAWLGLIAPATAPLYVANQHLEIMRSFVAQPQIHVAAMKNPTLVGGPYMNLGPDRVDDVRRLVASTAREQATLIKFAAAVKAADAALGDHPPGMSLEGLYPRLPEILRGYVELVYDLRNQPSLRPLEGLLYRSPLYREAAQSLLLWRVDRDDRPFVFSTPRLEDESSVHLRIPLRDPIVDELVELRRRPAPLGHFQDLLRLPEARLPLLRSFLTDRPPPPPPRWSGPGVRVRYFGHACLLLESRGVTILADPALCYAYPAEGPRLTCEDLPERIDYALITHAHADHLLLETLIQLRGRIGTVVVPRSSGALQDPSLRLALRKLGFGRVAELDELEEIEVEGGSIVGLPFLGEHGDLGVRAKLAYLVRLEGRSAVIAADSSALEPVLYRRLREIVGPVDALFLGMECEGAPMSWVYGPLMMAQLSRKMDQSRRLSGSNAERAAAIAELLEARQVHVYAMGQEPWLGHIMGLRYTESSPQIVASNELIRRCREAGIMATRPLGMAELVLPPGA